VPLSGSGGIKGYPAVLSEKANDELFVRPSDSPRPSAPPIPAAPWCRTPSGRSLTATTSASRRLPDGMVYQFNYSPRTPASWGWIRGAARFRVIPEEPDG